MSNYRIRKASWQQASQALRMIRETVFICEQHVPEELEWDGEDESAIHLLAVDDDDMPVGCARILSNGHIGRMAVLQSSRGLGLGRRLLKRAIEVVHQQGHRVARLDAQTHAIPFYEQQGFHVEGEEFMDAGIPHRRMTLQL